MLYKEILSEALTLSEENRRMLMSALDKSLNGKEAFSRLASLLNKQARCPHCGGCHYYRYGKDKGIQRFKCKDCGRTFTEFTGTWEEGLQKKHLVGSYMDMMAEEKSLDKISHTLGINKKTAFDWRHKILSSLGQDEGKEFSGITESDETFFERSEKGCRHLKRKAHKRGGSHGIRGISRNKATVIVTADRKNELNMTFCGYGRMTKKEIEKSLRSPIPKDTILCTDSHVSYRGYAMDKKLIHIALRTDLGQHLKRGIYHIQHVNSLHSRLKKWIAGTFDGVATKYLQHYLNWFKAKQTDLKTAQCQSLELWNLAVRDSHAQFATH